MPDIPMPRLSDSMEEGTILTWLVEDGAEVSRGQEIAEIETDKATMAYEADVAGVLRIAVPAGQTVPVGRTIATIGDVPAPPASGAPGEDARPPAAPGSGCSGATASPVARRLARRLGLDLATVTGSGARGRVVKADVRAAAQAAVPGPGAGAAGARATQPAQAAAAMAAAEAAVAHVPAPAVPAEPAEAAPADGAAPAAGGPKGETTAEELNRVQKAVARRMAESKATVPHFAISMDVDMTEASALRAALKPILDPAPSVTDIVVKATALALRRHPRANGSYTDGRFELYRRVNVGVAVAASDALVVPTVFDADAKSLGAIAADLRGLAVRVRDGSVTAPELGGGTFTVSNLGMFGVDRFTAIVNPPQAGILCVGAVTERPVAVAGELVVRPVMTLTLSCDHRILYGADAARFLAEIRGLLEAPLGLHS
jgi:pyruvate dehydrogenase E2 component (dihydrolipoamide acetyltransferase)